MNIRREMFIRKYTMNQVLEMFHNILNVFQDGLILTDNEEIVYANSAVRGVYDLCVEGVAGADEKDKTRLE